MKFIDKIEIKNGIIIGIYKSNLSINLEDAKEILGDVAKIRDLFVDFQRYLYERKVA